MEKGDYSWGREYLDLWHAKEVHDRLLKCEKPKAPNEKVEYSKIQSWILASVAKLNMVWVLLSIAINLDWTLQ